MELLLNRLGISQDWLIHYLVKNKEHTQTQLYIIEMLLIQQKYIFLCFEIGLHNTD